jgi:hypothetical protein
LRKFYELDAAALDAIATASGTDLGRRPEELPVEAFVGLLHALPATATATATAMTEGGPRG